MRATSILLCRVRAPREPPGSPLRARLCFGVLFLDIPRQCLRRGLQESHHDVIASDTRAVRCVVVNLVWCRQRKVEWGNSIVASFDEAKSVSLSVKGEVKNVLLTNACVHRAPLPSLPPLGPAADAGEQWTRKANTAQVCGVRQARSAGDSVQPLSCLIYLLWQRQRTECNFLRGGCRRWGW